MKTSCRGDVFVLDELVPFDLQQLLKRLAGNIISEITYSVLTGI